MTAKSFWLDKGAEPMNELRNEIRKMQAEIDYKVIEIRKLQDIIINKRDDLREMESKRV